MFRPLVGCSSASLAEEEPFHKVSPPFLVEPRAHASFADYKRAPATPSQGTREPWSVKSGHCRPVHLVEAF